MTIASAEDRGACPGGVRAVPHVRKAAGFTELLSAFALVQENYVRLRYKDPTSGPYHFSLFNLHPDSTTLVGLLNNEVTGTVTLVPDSDLGMPCAGVFPELYEALKRDGHRMGEATMLADRRLSPSRAWPQLRSLFRMLVQAAQEQGLTRLLVLCHPHHATFYVNRLPFRQAGDVRPCGHVNGSPAVPLVLDLTAPGLLPRIDESLGHWGVAIDDPVEAPPAYRLNDHRAAALVAMQPPILIDAPPDHRRLIEGFYPTLSERLRFLDAGRTLLCG